MGPRCSCQAQSLEKSFYDLFDVERNIIELSCGNHGDGNSGAGCHCKLFLNTVVIVFLYTPPPFQFTL